MAGLNLPDLIVIGILLIIIGIAVAYIAKSKKKGVKCIGCPYAQSCSKKNADSGCGSGNQN